MHGQKMRRYKRYSQIEDESWQRDLRVFAYSLSIGLLLGGFGVYFFYGQPRAQQVAEFQYELSLCEKDKTTLDNMRDETAKKLAACTSRAVVTPKPVPPAPAVGDPLPVPMDTPAITTPSVSTGLPLPPRRPPSRPVGEKPQVEIVGAAKVSGPQSAIFRIGDQKELVAGFKIRLVGIAKRTSGVYCVVGGAGQPAVGTRIASGSSASMEWNNQKLNLAAVRQDAQSCKLTVTAR